MLGWVAAVIETESPSQLSPAVIQRTCTSFTADGFCVWRPYGASELPFVCAMTDSQKNSTYSGQLLAGEHGHNALAAYQ